MFGKKNRDQGSEDQASENPDFVDEAKQFVDASKKSIDNLRDTAVIGGESWLNILKSMELEPAPAAAKEQAKNSGLPIPKGAFPSEYRAVLFVQQFEFKEEIKNRLVRYDNDFDAEEVIDNFSRYFVSDLIKDEMKRYLDLSKPAVSVSDIFANASTSINKYSVKEEHQTDKSYNIKCKSCGASRLEEDQYDKCFYCGNPLFD